MSKLTPKQKRFVDEYLVDLNQTQAYIRAGYKVSEEVARTNASRLLSNANVAEYVQKRMAFREKRTEITQDRVLKELAKVGFADVKDYLEFRTEKSVVEDKYAKKDDDPVIDYRMIVDVKDSAEVDGAPISEVSIGKDGTFKFKLHDKMAALDKIGRHLGMFTDKVELTGNIDVQKMSDEELNLRIQTITEKIKGGTN